MKGREGKGPPSADLLVCFPSRAHLTLMAPKPNICSPSRPSSEPNPRHRRRHHQPQNHHHVRNASNRGVGGGGHASPLMWAKTKPNNSDISEPTSPKVTCAGQIKVRAKPNSCKSWQSVMEEIERLHNNRNKKKKHAWAEALGFKKDVMQFLTCLRNIRFDFRCFGAFPTAEITSDDEDDEEEETTYHRKIQTESKEEIDESESSRTFSKWFMILQENNPSTEVIKPEEGKRGKTIRSYFDEEELHCDDDDDDGPCEPPPPPNALQLMRCRSAPAKSWLEEKEEEEEEEEESEKEKELEEERKTEEERERLHVVMRCGTTDFSKFSSDIAKETWVVGGIKDMLSRSRSSKR